MQHSVIYTLLIDKFAPALCWTLVHSLWEGLIFAILASTVMVATKRSAPAVRYNALTVTFALFVLVAAATFVREWNHHLSGGRIAGAITRVHAIILGETGNHPSGRMEMGANGQTAEGASLWQQMTNFLSDHALLIATIWLLIVGIRVARTGYCILHTQRLKTHRSHPPADYWGQRLASLCTSMGIRRRIMLLESEVMKIPAVFGVLKPVIFVPIGLLAQLPPSQVEAMLVHELAHIRRNDFLVNFLQGLVENIFFFNPCVFWISSLIRESREHCCDDIAIGQTKDKQQFIETLISLTERQMNNGPAYVLGFEGRRGGSAGRVARIVSNNNKTLNMKENFFLGLGLLVVGSLTLGFSGKGPVKQVQQAPQQVKVAPEQATLTPEQVQQAPQQVRVTPEQMTIKTLKQAQDQPTATTRPAIAQDTVPATGRNSGEDRYIQLRINAARDLVVEVMLKGVDYRFRRVNGAITELSVDNKQIPKEEMSKYNETIEKICRNADDHFAHPDLEGEGTEARSQEIMEARKLELAQEKLAAQAEYRELASRMEELQKQQAMLEQKSNELRAQEAFTKGNGVVMKGDAVITNDQEAALKENVAKLKDYEAQLAENTAKLRKTMAGIREDLVKKHVVANEEEIKQFSLDKETLFVNGVQQSAELHRYFQDKYLTDEVSEIRSGDQDMIRSDAKP